MASNVELSSLNDNTQLVRRLNNLDARVAFAECQRIIALNQDTSSDHTADIKAAANVINSVVQNLHQNLAQIQTQVLSGNSVSDPNLRAAWDNGNAQIAKLQEAVGAVNASLHLTGSSMRLQWTASGVKATTVSAAQAPSNPSSTGATPTPMSHDLTRDSTGPGLQLDQQVDPNIRNSSLYPVIKLAVTMLLQDLLQGSTTQPSHQSGQPLSGNGGATSQLSALDYANLGEGVQGLDAGNGSQLFNALLRNLKKAAEQAAGQQPANAKSAKNSKAAASGAATPGTGTGAKTGASASTGTAAQPAGTPSNPGSSAMGGNDNLPISNGAGGSVTGDAGAAGDPYIGQPNVNGFLMMVLLECYQEGQKDLMNLAKRLQDINNQKKNIRATLAQDRTALNGTAPGSAANQAATSKEQNDEDMLNSLGDDAQLEQLDLQNMAQNQQQLLQMISNFSKNTHDDSMAIIRHIGGG